MPATRRVFSDLSSSSEEECRRPLAKKTKTGADQPEQSPSPSASEPETEHTSCPPSLCTDPSSVDSPSLTDEADPDQSRATISKAAPVSDVVAPVHQDDDLEEFGAKVVAFMEQRMREGDAKRQKKREEYEAEHGPMPPLPPPRQYTPEERHAQLERHCIEMWGQPYLPAEDDEWWKWDYDEDGSEGYAPDRTRSSWVGPDHPLYAFIKDENYSTS